MAHQGYGFCEFLTEEDAEYACKIMNQIKLWGKPIRVNKVSLSHHILSRHLLSSILLSLCLGFLGQEAT
jgi:RNA recognition motif-containing protein